MFYYKSHFDKNCRNHHLDLKLSFDMSSGYDSANANFDVETKTVFINEEYLNEAPDYENAYYLFHELRHASQYLCIEASGTKPGKDSINLEKHGILPHRKA